MLSQESGRDAWFSLISILKSSAVLAIRFINEGKYAAISLYKSEIASLALAFARKHEVAMTLWLKELEILMKQLLVPSPEERIEI